TRIYNIWHFLCVFVIWTSYSPINEHRTFSDTSLAIAVVPMIFLFFQVGYLPTSPSRLLQCPMSWNARSFSLRSKNSHDLPVLRTRLRGGGTGLPETKGKGLKEIDEIFDGDELLSGT
ncbi:hypothetical protein DPV78_012468, partial [Talaromyces pinophilus]